MIPPPFELINSPLRPSSPFGFSVSRKPLQPGDSKDIDATGLSLFLNDFSVPSSRPWAPPPATTPCSLSAPKDHLAAVTCYSPAPGYSAGGNIFAGHPSLVTETKSEEGRFQDIRKLHRDSLRPSPEKNSREHALETGCPPGRRPLYAELEQELAQEYRKAIEQNLTVTAAFLLTRAKKLFFKLYPNEVTPEGDTVFRFSPRWFAAFKKRHNIDKLGRAGNGKGGRRIIQYMYLGKHSPSPPPPQRTTKLRGPGDSTRSDTRAFRRSKDGATADHCTGLELDSSVGGNATKVNTPESLPPDGKLSFVGADPCSGHIASVTKAEFDKLSSLLESAPHPKCVSSDRRFSSHSPTAKDESSNRVLQQPLASANGAATRTKVDLISPGAFGGFLSGSPVSARGHSVSANDGFFNDAMGSASSTLKTRSTSAITTFLGHTRYATAPVGSSRSIDQVFVNQPQPQSQPQTPHFGALDSYTAGQPGIVLGLHTKGSSTGSVSSQRSSPIGRNHPGSYPGSHPGSQLTSPVEAYLQPKQSHSSQLPPPPPSGPAPQRHLDLYRGIYGRRSSLQLDPDGQFAVQVTYPSLSSPPGPMWLDHGNSDPSRHYSSRYMSGFYSQNAPGYPSQQPSLVMDGEKCVPCIPSTPHSVSYLSMSAPTSVYRPTPGALGQPVSKIELHTTLPLSLPRDSPKAALVGVSSDTGATSGARSQSAESTHHVAAGDAMREARTRTSSQYTDPCLGDVSGDATTPMDHLHRLSPAQTNPSPEHTYANYPNLGQASNAVLSESPLPLSSPFQLLPTPQSPPYHCAHSVTSLYSPLLGPSIVVPFPFVSSDLVVPSSTASFGHQSYAKYGDSKAAEEQSARQHRKWADQYHRSYHSTRSESPTQPTTLSMSPIDTEDRSKRMDPFPTFTTGGTATELSSCSATMSTDMPGATTLSSAGMTPSMRSVPAFSASDPIFSHLYGPSLTTMQVSSTAMSQGLLEPGPMGTPYPIYVDNSLKDMPAVIPSQLGYSPMELSTSYSTPSSTAHEAKTDRGRP